MLGKSGRSLRQRLERQAGHLVFGSRKWVERQVRDVASELDEARILEIGSGRQDLGDGAYSMAHLFGEGNTFVQSDVDPEYGHEVVDVTSMDYVEEWDVILCVSVLEHVPDFRAAVRAIHRALTPEGIAMVVVPMCFPYHDEPDDYWRFTSYGMKVALAEFDSVDVRWRGPRRLPFTTMAIARKKQGQASG